MTVGIYLPDRNVTLPDGRPVRTQSAIHFAGRYRLIDFTLSNLVNSGVQRIGIGLGSEYQTLVAHIGSGRDWDLSRKIGGVTFYPPYLSDGILHGATERLKEGLTGYAADNVIFCDGSIFYNMNYRAAIDVHQLQYSDITSIVTERNGEEVPLHTYIMSKTVAMALLERISHDHTGIEHVNELINAQFSVRKYEFSGYSGQINSLTGFYEYNMEMLDAEKRNALFKNPIGRVYTSARDSQPTNYGPDADVRNSIIADGCQIYGTVTNSVIFRRVVVGRGAVVSDSILQNDTIVEPGAEVSYTVTDKNVVITPRQVLIGSPNGYGNKVKPLFIHSDETI
ncbi:MAG: hypothetical protein LBN43_02565 [Oscillospiraceae bacterium]|jgi:glucose-1-phosphate adenylyltransferase|nr:hypothetical protein [Oscillospiraceae bacterium]